MKAGDLKINRPNGHVARYRNAATAHLAAPESVAVFVSESIRACDRRSIRYSSELECDTFTPWLDILFWFVF